MDVNLSNILLYFPTLSVLCYTFKTIKPFIQHFMCFFLSALCYFFQQCPGDMFIKFKTFSLVVHHYLQLLFICPSKSAFIFVQLNLGYDIGHFNYFLPLNILLLSLYLYRTAAYLLSFTVASGI